MPERWVAALLVWVAAGSIQAEPTLRVSVAVSLLPPISEVARGFRAEHGSAVALNAAASGILLQQVRRGARADILISASPEEVDRLVAEGLAEAATRRPLASNRLVVVVPVGGVVPERIEQLAQPGFDRIATGNPRTAPLGRYARQALETLGLWQTLEPRLVVGESARVVLDYVARGEVAAGIVYRTDAGRSPSRVVLGPEVPADAHEPILYEAVVLTPTADRRLASAFLEWLTDGPGVRTLRDHGFTAPAVLRVRAGGETQRP